VIRGYLLAIVGRSASFQKSLVVTLGKNGQPHSSEVVWRKKGPSPRTSDATYIEGPRPQTPRTRKTFTDLINMAAYSEQMFVATRIEDHTVENPWR
jgi:hypothetical protein